MKISPRLIMLATTACAMFGQSVPAAPEFAAVSVKPSGPDSGSGIRTSPDSLTMLSVTLKTCIRNAYHMQEYQISGGPGWIDSDKYDIVAKAPGKARDAELMLMLQKLLSDRFKLVVSPEKKVGAIYALTLVKNVTKLQAVSGGEDSYRMHKGKMTGKGVTLASLAEMLSSVVKRPVVDKTGMAGAFDIRLEWAPDTRSVAVAPDRPEAQPSGDGSIPSIFTALQEQLGLKLVAERGPMDTLVIKQVERASEN